MTSKEALALVEQAICHNRRIKSGLSPLQRTVFCYAWEACSYGEIAKHSGYELSYVKQAGSQLWQLLSQALAQKVTKRNVRLTLQRSLPLSESALSTLELTVVPAVVSAAPAIDWGDAVDVSCFYGREAELKQLMQWTVGDRCRLIGIFGMGGIGKTALSIRSAQQLNQQSCFSKIIWRSLRNAPPLGDLIADLLQVLLPAQATDTAQKTAQKTIDQQLSRLLNYLRQHRCLIVLDNGETVMSLNNNSSASNYEMLWQQLGQTPHQSTILLTSREKPPSLAADEGSALPVRSLRLKGLPAHLAQSLFDLKGHFKGSAPQWQQLVDYYAGNPLALKMVAAVIQELFDGQVGNFLDCLQVKEAVFGDIQDLLSQQIDRLSVLQQQTLDWLAIARQPITISQLRANFTPVLGLNLGELLAALSALERRSLIEKLPPSLDQHQPSFTLQPVVMEYVTCRLIERVCEQMHTRQLIVHSPLASHALIQAQAPDYICQTQTQLILKPIADQLLAMSSRADWARTIRQWLSELRQMPSQIGYAGGNLINLLTQMQIDLSGWDFSQLPIWSAYLKNVTLHGVSFAQSDLSHSAFSDTFSQVLAVAFSPDGKLLATGDINHEIQLWRVADGQLLLTLTVQAGWIWSVAFSPDGRLVAASANQAVHLWDIQSGALIQRLNGYSDRVFSVAFSPDGQLLATGSEDQWVRIWEWRTGTLRHQLSGHTDEVRSVAFATHYQNCQRLMLASASYDGTVRLWDAVSGACTQVLPGGSKLRSVAFSPDGQTLASGGAAGDLKLWQCRPGSALRWQKYYPGELLNAQQPIRSLAFSPDGRTLASGSDDGKVWLWNYHTGELLKVLSGHTSWISAIAFSVDHLLASGSEDRTVRLWHNNLCQRQLQGYSNGIWSVAFNPTGELLASGSQDRYVRLWLAKTGELLGSLAGHTSWIWSVAFSPTQPTVASSSEDGTIRIWDICTQQQRHLLTGHKDAVISLLYTPQGTLWSGSLDGSLKQWTAAGSCLQTLDQDSGGHSGGVWALALSLDGKRLLSGSQDQTLKLWDADSGRVINTLIGHQSWIRAVAISPDAQTLFSGSADGTLKIWQADDSAGNAGRYRCLQTHAAHSGPVLSIAVHSSGQQIVTSSTDHSIKLWNLKTGTYQAIAQAHDRWVKSLTYSPDGSTLASCSQDETIKLWHATPLENAPTLRQTLRIPRPYEALNIEQASGLTSAQRSALQQLGATT